MEQPLDGLYRHRGVSLTWDEHGVTLSRMGTRWSVSAAWADILGARQIGERPGYVQVLVQGHVPPRHPKDDPFAIAVNGEADANRLVTSIEWRATPAGATQASATRMRLGLRRWRGQDD